MLNGSKNGIGEEGKQNYKDGYGMNLWLIFNVKCEKHWIYGKLKMDIWRNIRLI